MSDDVSTPIPDGAAQPQPPPQTVLADLPAPVSSRTPAPEPAPMPEPAESSPPEPVPSSPPPEQPQPQPDQGNWPVSPTQSLALGTAALSVPPVLSPVPPPPGGARWRRPPLWTLIAGGVALVGLVVGLLVWAPWSPPPQAPTAVRVSSPTATTARVAWTAPKGGAKPDEYNIFRDGKEQGIVPGNQTSWTDTGLEPGSKHSYTVVTKGNGQTSVPSVKRPVTTITPAPVGVTETASTYTTATLRWSPPPNAPAPDLYTIYGTSTGKVELVRIQGEQTSYTVTQLIAGDDYSFGVMASWGSAVSTLASVDASPLSPPLSGSVPVNMKVTKILAGSKGIAVGDTWSDTWKFTANCPATTCTLTDKGSIVADVGPFTARLTPVKGGYQGKATHVQFSHCGGVNSYETVTVQIHPVAGGVSNGAWTSWRGTMTLAYPGQTVGNGYCDAGNWVLALSGTGS